MSYVAGVKLIVCFTKSLTRPNYMLIYFFYFYMVVRSRLIINYISNLLLNLMDISNGPILYHPKTHE